MITGEIQDWQISASSTYPNEWDKGCHERYARLYQPSGLSWCAKYKAPSEWLQVDLGVAAKVHIIRHDTIQYVEVIWTTIIDFAILHYVMICHSIMWYATYSSILYDTRPFYSSILYCTTTYIVLTYHTILYHPIIYHIFRARHSYFIGTVTLIAPLNS